MDDVLAIVGSIYFKLDRHGYAVANDFVGEYIQNNPPTKIVSGGAAGIDTIAVNWAKKLGIHYQEFLPVNKQWEPNGYKDRNVKIVENCTRLVRISHHLSITYGSGWTAHYAEVQSIPVERYAYNPYNVIERL